MNVRIRHLIAYASSMLSLLVFQVIFYTDLFARVSDFGQDVIYTLVAEIFCMGVVPFVVLLIAEKGKVPLLMKRMRYKAPRDKKACLLVSLALMALITPFTMAFNALTNLFFMVVGYHRAHPIGTIYLNGGDFVLMLVLTGVLPAFFEEFTHRGVLLSGLESRGSELSAVVLSSVMFGLMHTNPAQLIYAIAGGLVFGVAVVKCDSVIPALCAHFANNAVSVILEYSTQKQTAIGVLYEKLFSSGSALSVAVTFVVLGLALYGVASILQYAARKAPKPVSEKKLLGVVTLDAYSPEGKATLKDNALLYATMIAEGVFVIVLFVWGIVK